jgi:hypothetical protein
MDAEPTEKVLTPLDVKTKDDEQFTVEVETVAMCGILRTTSTDTTNAKNVVNELANINARELQLVRDYCVHYKGKAPIKGPFKSSVMDPWDKEFLDKRSGNGLIALTMGAKFMELPSLVDTCALAIATRIRGKDEAALRVMFNVTTIFSKEQIDKIKTLPEYIHEHPQIPASEGIE